MEKSSFYSDEGTINLLEENGWKFKKSPDACLFLMDKECKRVISYHYGEDYVRLLVNKPGGHNP